MTKEECKVLLQSQNWYKLFKKRVIENRGAYRMAQILQDAHRYDCITGAFCWDDTPEGIDYWSEISRYWSEVVEDVS